MKRRQELARIKEENRIEKFKQRLKELAEIEHNAAAKRLQKTKEVQRYQIAQVDAKQKKVKEELFEWKQEGFELRRMSKEHEQTEHHEMLKRENAKAEMRNCFHGMKFFTF